MTMNKMIELSPAALAVYKAYYSADGYLSRPAIAAALRAAADQVVPETTTPWNSTLTPIISVQEVRTQLFAIATELEGSNV